MVVQWFVMPNSSAAWTCATPDRHFSGYFENGVEHVFACTGAESSGRDRHAVVPLSRLRGHVFAAWTPVDWKTLFCCAAGLLGCGLSGEHPGGCGTGRAGGGQPIVTPQLQSSPSRHRLARANWLENRNLSLARQPHMTAICGKALGVAIVRCEHLLRPSD